MRIKCTVYKSEPYSLHSQTYATTLSSLLPQTCGCAAILSSLNKAFTQFQQKLILKVGVANAITNLITINLRKQLT